MASDISYATPQQQPSPVALDCYPDGGVTLTVRPPAIVASVSRFLTGRQDRPLVVAVTSRSMYVDNPNKWIKPRRFYRHAEVDDLSVRREEVRDRGWRTDKYVFQLVLHVRFEWPLTVLEAKTPQELLAIANPIRAALKWPPQDKALDPGEVAEWTKNQKRLPS